MLIIDLGCNVGDTIRQFKTEYPHSRVLGIELDEEVAVKAIRNIFDLSNVEIFSVAIGWPERDTEAWIDITDTVSTVNPYQEERLNTFAFPRPTRIRSLDSVLCSLGLRKEIIDILKIDIEGEEENLILGGGSWVSRTNKIYLECHRDEYISSCSDKLEEYG